MNTWIADRIASLPCGGLLLTWSTFQSIREGRARAAVAELGPGRAVVMTRDGAIRTIAELAARADRRQHASQTKIVRPAARGTSAGPADQTT